MEQRQSTICNKNKLSY